ncbi:ZrgA family zinc uptake protein [Ferrimonas aestuarii]|uniref:DUF2796 domain-containing protein n=1 Tax=Ferrimonas aestuarii TaxID=2569539 RepID=A0A4U1BSF7_9GAMM|nr:DUF2796 domain-containing protein [Ferrimonas aestuarii]TKB57533.1 DUF2796 domain-containing protein [Ferrimonas aestuarii]
MTTAPISRLLPNSIFAMGLLGLSATSVAAFDAHQHGIAELNYIQEGQQIEIEFSSPLANLVGFEHAPEGKQVKVYLEAVSRLKQASHFAFRGESCDLNSRSIELPFEPESLSVDDHEGHEHEDHEHEGHEHEGHEHEGLEHEGHEHEGHEHEGHEHEGHEHEGHEHEGHDHEGHEHSGEHSNLTITYQFQCDGQVEQVELGLFKVMPQLESINMQWLIGVGQGATSVERIAPWVKL